MAPTKTLLSLGKNTIKYKPATRRNITMNRITNNILMHNAPTEINNVSDLQIHPVSQESRAKKLVSRGVYSDLSSRTNIPGQNSVLGGNSLYHTKANNMTTYSNY
jgi:hypothetical protein